MIDIEEKLKNINELWFSGKKLSFITRRNSSMLPYFNQLSRLTDLSIGESDVGSVGIAFVLDRFRSILPTLKILSCSENNMQDIPRIFQQLNDLQSLDLSKNQIENCWNLPYSPKLLNLDLSENKLNFFQDFLQKSTLIESLYLNKNEFLRNIPDWIHKLPLLKYLYIFRTGIESLPVEFIIKLIL